MKKNKPKKKRPKIARDSYILHKELESLIRRIIREEIPGPVKRMNLDEITIGERPPFHNNLRNDFKPISDKPAGWQLSRLEGKRTPIRDYLRLFAIVVGLALVAHFAIKKMSGPPKGALYQISSGPGRTWTDYASAKPTLTASGCVVWFDLDNLGNIFCGEFVISDVPGRVVHE